MLDLLSTEPTGGDRLRVRAEVKEAVDSLEAVRSTAPYVARSIRILQTMLEEEEAQFIQRSNSGAQPAGQGKGNVLSLALKIKHAIEHNAPLDTSATRANEASDEVLIQSPYVPPGDHDTNVGIGLLHGSSSSGRAAASAAGFPTPAEFPYLLGPPGGLDPPPVAPNGTMLTPGVSGPGFDFGSFLASYQSEASSRGSDTTPLSSFSQTQADPSEDKPSPPDKLGPTDDMQLDPPTTQAATPSVPQGDQASGIPSAQTEGNRLDSFWAWVLSQDGGPSSALPPLEQPATAPATEGQQPSDSQEQESYWSRYAGNGAPILPGPLLPQVPQIEQPEGESQQTTQERRSSMASVGSIGSMVSAFGTSGGGGFDVPTPLPARRAETPMTPSRAAGGSVDPFEYEGGARRSSTASAMASPQIAVGSPGFDSWFATSLESFLQN